MRRRLRKAVYLFAACAFLAAAYHIVYLPWSVHRELDAALAETDRLDPGWRYNDLQAKREVIPDEENGGLKILEISKHLPKDWPQWTGVHFANEEGRSEEEIRSQANYFSYTVLAYIPAEAQLNEQETSAIAAELQLVAETVKEGRMLGTYHKGRLPFTVVNGEYEVLANSVKATERIATLLRLDSLLRLQHEEFDEVFVSCNSLFRLAEFIGEEPGSNVQWQRQSIQTTAINVVKRSLAQGEFTDNQLKKWQTLAWEGDKSTNLKTVLFSSRLFADWRFENIVKDSKAKLQFLQFGHESDIHPAAETQLSWFDRHALSFADKIAKYRTVSLRLHNKFMDLAELSEQEVWHGVKTAIVEAGLDGEGLWIHGPPFLSPEFLYECRSFLRQRMAFRTLGAALAVERFRLKMGEFPAKIEELVPQFLNGVPTDIFTNRSLVYRRLVDGAEVYSLGEDESDNSDVTPHALGYPDIGVRLWNSDRRRQPPLPEMQLPPLKGEEN